MGNECKFCEESEVLFQNEFFVVYKAKTPECLSNHFVIELTRHVANEDELIDREKFWLELTINSAKSYFAEYHGLSVVGCQLLVDICSPYFHVHIFEPVSFWQPIQGCKLTKSNLAEARVIEIQRHYAGIEAGL